MELSLNEFKHLQASVLKQYFYYTLCHQIPRELEWSVMKTTYHIVSH